MNWYKMSQKTIDLWLDDERDPQNIVIQEAFGSSGNEIWVKTVEEAKKYILGQNVGSISFDNDLGVEEEGYDLAKWIEEMAYYHKIPEIKWKIHSRNPIAAQRIKNCMENADKYWQS